MDSGPQFCGPGVGLTQLHHFELEIMLMQYAKYGLNRKVFKEVRLENCISNGNDILYHHFCCYSHIHFFLLYIVNAMVNCDYCDYSTEDLSNLNRHFKSVHLKDTIECYYCEEIISRKDSLLRHIQTKHKKKIENMIDISASFDVTLKENFKLFVSGPSRCGKTVFVSKLIENIQGFAKLPPESIIYVYKVWQDKYDEMSAMGINFMKDNENIVDKIKSTTNYKLFWLSLMVVQYCGAED